MKKRGSKPGFNAKWWNEECRALAKQLREAQSDEEKTPLARSLKTLIATRKRQWADEYISSACIWEVAAWRHGRKSSHIPALRDSDGVMKFDHADMAEMLAECFFAEEGQPIPLSFSDDPPQRHIREFVPLVNEELERQLKLTSNTSAPGSSGIGWLILKKAWPVISANLTNIYNACLRLGYHPTRWKEASVVVIPKPGKDDYSLAKSHRPISLLKTMSKLMEKGIAKRFQHDLVAHELVASTQFRGRMHSSCLDMALMLVHDVQTAHRTGLKAGMVLFDVKGFFDNINHKRMVAVLENLGFDQITTGWIRTFLHERKVCLKFNCITSEERIQPVRVPQGSPLSLVLSIIYTSGLLHQMRH